MPPPNRATLGDLTLLLQAVADGETGADEQLMARVYAELRSIAAAKLARERQPQTLQPTALVHEAWLRLGADQQPPWQNRAHFFAAAGEAMRRVLVDRARRRKAARRGGDRLRVSLGAVDTDLSVDPDQRLLELDEVLDRFARHDPEAAQVVKLHYFVGLSMRETADACGISEATAWRWWNFARAWLLRELQQT